MELKVQQEVSNTIASWVSWLDELVVCRGVPWCAFFFGSHRICLPPEIGMTSPALYIVLVFFVKHLKVDV